MRCNTHALTSYKPTFIFNMDETMLARKNKNVKVYAPRDLKNPKRIEQVTRSMHITLVCAVAADGSTLKTTVILPLKHFPRELQDMSEEFHWAGQQAGWIDSSIYRDWVVRVFVPEVLRRREACGNVYEPALLWVDGHSSRADPEAIAHLTNNGIDVAVIPAHTSHLLQPLDRGIFRRFKQALSNMRGKFPRDCSAADYRKGILASAQEAWHLATYRNYVTDAWKAAALYPWNVRAIRDDPTKVNLTGSRPKPPRRGQNISGRVLVFTEVQQVSDTEPLQMSPSAQRITPPHVEDDPDAADQDSDDTAISTPTDPCGVDSFLERRAKRRANEMFLHMSP